MPEGCSVCWLAACVMLGWKNTSGGVDVLVGGGSLWRVEHPWCAEAGWRSSRAGLLQNPGKTALANDLD